MLEALRRFFTGPGTANTEQIGAETACGLRAGRHPNFITDKRQIRSVLIQLEAEGELLEIALPGLPGKFSSSLLDICSDTGRVILEELVPEPYDRNEHPLDTFKVCAMFQGTTVAFDLTGIKVGTFQGHKCFNAAIPQKVYYPQRRHLRRYPIGQDNPLIFQALYGDANDVLVPMHGSLVDISEGGVAALLANNGTRICKGELLKHCRLPLPDGEEIRFDLQLLFVKPRRNDNDRLQIGGRFVGMGSECQRKLNRLLTVLERESLRLAKSHSRRNSFLGS